MAHAYRARAELRVVLPTQRNQTQPLADSWQNTVAKRTPSCVEPSCFGRHRVESRIVSGYVVVGVLRDHPPVALGSLLLIVTLSETH